MGELKSPWLFRRHDIVRARSSCSSPTPSSSRSRAAASSRRDGCDRRSAPCSTSATASRSGPPPASRGLPASRPRGSVAGIAKAHRLGLQALVYTVDDPKRLLAFASGRRRRRSVIVRIEHWQLLLVGQAEQAGAVGGKPATTRMPTVRGAAREVERSAVSVRSPRHLRDAHARLAPRNVCETTSPASALPASSPFARPMSTVSGRTRQSTRSPRGGHERRRPKRTPA